jgi:hypothetical protein
MSRLDMRGLAAALNEAEVRFVTIGGVAVAAHGFVRATEDIDLVPDPDASNLMRLGNALAGLDATLPTSGGRRFATRDLRPGVNLTLDTALGGVDIVQRASGVPSFASLDVAAVASDIDGEPIRVCSLSHLRQMKATSGRAIDVADLEELPPS